MIAESELQIDTIQAEYRVLSRIKNLVLLVLSLALIAASAYALTSGTVTIRLREVLTALSPWAAANEEFQINDYIIRQVRLPRIVAALTTGMALAVGGTIMQAVLRNPLASPFTLGVSSGASFGAALAIVLGTSVFGRTLVASGQVLIALNAFVFGCLSLGIVYTISRLKMGSTTVLLLAGVAISSIFGAGVSALRYFSDNEALRDLSIWLLGGFWGVDWQEIAILVPTLAVALLILFRYAWDLNAIIGGDDVAETMGVHVRRVQFVTLVTVTLVASAAIAFSGVIGFVGLVAPHIIRSFIGADNRFLIPGAALTGGVMLLLADTVARIVIAPVEVPVGIITSLVGGPFFIYILVARERTIWD